jgi:hypothetical protein
MDGSGWRGRDGAATTGVAGKGKGRRKKVDGLLSNVLRNPAEAFGVVEIPGDEELQGNRERAKRVSRSWNGRR